MQAQDAGGGRIAAWFATAADPGEYEVEDLRFGPEPDQAVDGIRLIRVEIALADGAPPPGPDGRIAQGADFEVLRLNDPLLEAEALRTMEADAAGVGPGDLWYALVHVGPEGLHAAAFADADRALAFLEGEVAMAEEDGGPGHWAEILAGDIPCEGTPPILMSRDVDGPEVLDGMHRLAGHVAHGSQSIAAILGVAPGFGLPDLPGALLLTPSTAVPAEGPAPR
jgi:hypothetical protein